MPSPDAPNKNPLFTYHPPQGAPLRALVSIPHSGEDVPEAFRGFLTTDARAMLEDVDFRVNELVDIPRLTAGGVGVLVAHVHRVCVDLNRAEDNCVLFWRENTHGVPLVLKAPSAAQASEWVQRFHRPYFEVFSAMIRDLERALPGKVPVVDLHSMPSAPTAYHMKQNPKQGTHRADFCVSDQRGKTCAPAFIEGFVVDLRGRGFEVAVNDPYIGGYVTTFVDRFRTDNIQIEINRRLYMDESSKTLRPDGVARLRRELTACLLENLVSK